MPNTIDFSDPWSIVAISIGLFLGGIMKGATGAGMPVIAVPVIAAFFDVRTAVVVLVLPNLISNLWQVFQYRERNDVPTITRPFAVAGLLGAAIGTLMLVGLPGRALNVFLALIVFAYVGLRLMRPAFRLSIARAIRLAPGAGLLGGVLQGAVGLSAPVAVTFASSIRLERAVFIFTISTYFAALCVAQIPLQIAFGLLTWSAAIVGAVALIPLFAGLSLGERIGRKMNAVVFDRVILTMLVALALRQVADAIL